MIPICDQITELRAVAADRADPGRFGWNEISADLQSTRRQRLAAAIDTLVFVERHAAAIRALAREAIRLAETPQMAALLAAFPGAEITAIRPLQQGGAS